MRPNFVLTTITCAFCGRVSEKMIPRIDATRLKNVPHGHFCDKRCASRARYRRRKAQTPSVR